MKLKSVQHKTIRMHIDENAFHDRLGMILCFINTHLGTYSTIVYLSVEALFNDKILNEVETLVWERFTKDSTE